MTIMTQDWLIYDSVQVALMILSKIIVIQRDFNEYRTPEKSMHAQLFLRVIDYDTAKRDEGNRDATEPAKELQRPTFIHEVAMIQHVVFQL